jgi:HNH endonuclease
MATRTHRLHELLARTPENQRFCKHCGSRENPSLDHIIPISRGGSDAWANIQILCRPCNDKKGARLDKFAVSTGKLRPSIHMPMPPPRNVSQRKRLCDHTLEELWAAYEDAHRERRFVTRRQRLEALSREIDKRQRAQSEETVP